MNPEPKKINFSYESSPRPTLIGKKIRNETEYSTEHRHMFVAYNAFRTYLKFYEFLTQRIRAHKTEGLML